MQVSSERLIVGAVLALSAASLVVQAFVLRPHLWPAGAGFAVSGENVMGMLAEPRPVAVIRPPDVRAAAGQPITVTRVWPGGAADRAGLRVGDLLRTLPPDPADSLRTWREMQQQRPGVPLALSITSAATGEARQVIVEQPAIWSMDGATWATWLRLHAGPLSQMTAFLAGAATLLALGARGSTAMLMTLALIVTAAANGGPLLGSAQAIPVLGTILLIFNWIITALSFPIIGLAVLFFPHRAEILDRHRWIVPAVVAAALPMLVIGSVSAAFLLGIDAALPALTWMAERAWTFDACFALGLGANVLIAIEGIGRYRTNPDANERRRIQIVVFTGVPAVFAYALKTGVPLLSGLAGRPVELPWLLEALLQAIVLLPAFGLPYAVAVRHVFSPRTVLRRSLQYAFARRTLAVLVVLPVIALVASLVQQRDLSLSMIVSGRPLFYLACLALLGLGLRYQVAAQRWLDQHFFRSEYDAREILVSLAARVPYEENPRELVAMVVGQIDTALHPEGVAVLARAAQTSPGTVPGEGAAFEPVTALHVSAAPLAGDSGIITLLRWSDKPLEIFLDDEQSPVARVPPADRLWLAEANAALLVPIFAGLSRAESRGGSDPRPFVGLIALGPKRSEEPYTSEDRELLRGIAVQMGVALDLSRLRQQAYATQPLGGTQAFTPTIRVDSGRTTPAIGVGAVVDNKYRVDAMVGQGGMGAVFRAWDVRLERAVAIKVVRGDLLADPDSRERFRRESQIVARLQHPSVVTVFDYGTLGDGAAFLVMEFVPGEDLRQLLKRERRLTPARAAELLAGIAGGVDSAHKAGIFHRDLKPENILLPESGTGPKVVDFGVAKLNTGNVAGGTLTGAGTIVGTPAYMAPEQLRGDSVDGRADVFSLGVMTFEMLTSKLPYGGASLFDIGMKQAAGPAAIDMSDVPDGMAAAIRRAIAFDRNERPQSPLAFAEELKKAISSS
ncbi:MAG: protein kinase [Acidobacteriota bacterium]|nr:protein kinase [Acidobacteriota bacterium]